MALAPGTVLAHRFEVAGPPLGAGDSGVVYPCVDRETGREVAAKVLHADRPDARARLQDEAGVAGRLGHAAVVEVLGVWADRPAEGPDRWVLVTELVRGAVPLSALATPLAPEAVAALGAELAGALEAAHALGVVHGDVRPGNVLLAPSGAKLFDFGVRGSIRPGETAPEVEAGAPAGPAADVYGLGVVLFRALHGRFPFEGPTLWAAMGAQRNPVRVPGPRGLATLIGLLLHPNPAARPDSLAAIREALAHLRPDPSARLRLRRPLPPIRPGAAWLVHGTDPATGAPALVRTRMSGRAAARLVERLRAEGWQVRAAREALGWRDLAWVLGLGVVGGVLVPVVGAFPGVWLALRWRASRTRPALARALPALKAPLPPRELPEGVESAAVAGVLLLATAAALAAWPPMALAPIAALLLLALWSWRTRRADPEARLREGRVDAVLADLRRSAGALALDDGLALAGEVDALEADWRGGHLAADALLVRADTLLARSSARRPDVPVDPVLDALRRSDDP